jgi:uncharacterized protein YbcC (UPF0753/DUF2309 family)
MYTDTERARLREIISLASEIIAPYYPMRTFVHHNPLHGLEHLHFDEAVRCGDQLLGGNGYLSNEIYRSYFKTGRILLRHVDVALRPLVRDLRIVLGDRSVTHLELLRACLLANPSAGATHTPPLQQISAPINTEMVKWCEAFLDEGHAVWPMPGREKGFYLAWKSLAALEWSPYGIANRKKITDLPNEPTDALIAQLAALGVPFDQWHDYLSQQLTSLPGWTGFIKWRAGQSGHPWQKAYPIDLVQYLAVRLWYQMEAATASGERTATNGRGKGVTPPLQEGAKHLRLVTLANALKMNPTALMEAAPESLQTLVEWIDAFPESDHGPIWLTAFEAGYQEQLVDQLQANMTVPLLPSPSGGGLGGGRGWDKGIRHQAQAIFCIDVRSEPFRRHLEAVGDYDTFGFAGFFSVFIRYQALMAHHDLDQFPVMMQAKNAIREVTRSSHGTLFERHQVGANLLRAGHELLRDLKENVVTPYVTVEFLGWLFGLPLIGKALFAEPYRRGAAWLRGLFTPPVATILPVDQLSQTTVMEMLAAEQRAVIRQQLKEQFGDRDLNLSLGRLEFLRKRALNEAGADPSSGITALPDCAVPVALTEIEEDAFIEILQCRYRMNAEATTARIERITRIGFTLNEQVSTVETALRIMGLKNFARLVLFCGHGGSSDNNPFEAALDCGACGGNTGEPNARVLAAMANKPLVRERLAKNGIVIPDDTYFIAGRHDTTRDTVTFFDLEDLPHTHSKDILRLTADLKEAGRRNSQERSARFPEIAKKITRLGAVKEVRKRSSDWSQVRPEWGLSGNAAFIVGSRTLTRGISLEGRAFLHSYNHQEDPTGRFLEIIMTGPQVVAQWINMEHYFSTVDNAVYGAGSKVYHNVVGRFGVMSGPQSDLRVGLAQQMVMSGHSPYHEPMRLLSLIEAPLTRISSIIERHTVLQHFYDNEWVRLIALDPEEKIFYRYVAKQGWAPLEFEANHLESGRALNVERFA